MKTIGLVYGDLSIGGIQRGASFQIPMFAAWGYRVVVLTNAPASDRDYPVEGMSARVPIGVAAGDTERRARAVERIIREYGIDILIHHHAYSCEEPRADILGASVVDEAGKTLVETYAVNIDPDLHLIIILNENEMSISKNIIDMMGGRISISSEENVGTEVVIEFDLKVVEAKKENESDVLEKLKGLRALVVDDDLVACASISKMLKDISMRSEWCTSGKEAVFRAETAFEEGDNFSVYIIDWLIPDMNGIETARRIRKVIGDFTPIIILTAYDWAEIEQEAYEAGVTAFVNKPLFMSDLKKTLAQCCGQESAEPESDGENTDFSGKKILLVEDNEMNREIACEILEEVGFVMDTAEDGTVVWRAGTCRVGGTDYASLSAACAAAGESGEVTLLGDYRNGESLSLSGLRLTGVGGVRSITATVSSTAKITVGSRVVLDGIRLSSSVERIKPLVEIGDGTDAAGDRRGQGVAPLDAEQLQQSLFVLAPGAQQRIVIGSGGGVGQREQRSVGIHLLVYLRVDAADPPRVAGDRHRTVDALFAAVEVASLVLHRRLRRSGACLRALSLRFGRARRPHCRAAVPRRARRV